MNMKQRTNGNGNGNGGANRPVHRVKRGNIEACVWQCHSRRNGVFYQVSVERVYSTADGKAGSSQSFSAAQVGDAILALASGAVWIEAQRQPRTREGDYSAEGSEAEFNHDAADYEQF
jgi:hypothetical protein